MGKCSSTCKFMVILGEFCMMEEAGQNQREESPRKNWSRFSWWVQAGPIANLAGLRMDRPNNTGFTEEEPSSPQWYGDDAWQREA